MSIFLVYLVAATLTLVAVVAAYGYLPGAAAQPASTAPKLLYTFPGRAGTDALAAAATAPAWILGALWTHLPPVSTPWRDLALALAVGMLFGLGSCVARALAVRRAPAVLVVAGAGGLRGVFHLLPPQWAARVASRPDLSWSLVRLAAVDAAASGCIVALFSAGVAELDRGTSMGVLWLCPALAATVCLTSRGPRWQRHVAYEALLALGLPPGPTTKQEAATVGGSAYFVPLLWNRALALPSAAASPAATPDVPVRARERASTPAERGEPRPSRFVLLVCCALLLYFRAGSVLAASHALVVGLLSVPAAYAMHRLRNYDAARFWAQRLPVSNDK